MTEATSFSFPTSPKDALECARNLIRWYPGKAPQGEDGEQFMTAIAAVLREYPLPIGKHLCGPRGIASKLSFFPTLAEIHDACEAEMAPIRREAERARRAKELREQIAPQEIEVSAEERARAVAVWEAMRPGVVAAPDQIDIALDPEAKIRADRAAAIIAASVKAIDPEQPEDVRMEAAEEAETLRRESLAAETERQEKLAAERNAKFVEISDRMRDRELARAGIEDGRPIGLEMRKKLTAMGARFVEDHPTNEENHHG